MCTSLQKRKRSARACFLTSICICIFWTRDSVYMLFRWAYKYILVPKKSIHVYLTYFETEYVYCKHKIFKRENVYIPFF